MNDYDKMIDKYRKFIEKRKIDFDFRDPFERYKSYIEMRGLISYTLYEKMYKILDYVNNRYWCFGYEFYDYVENFIITIWDEYLKDKENNSIKNNYCKKGIFQIGKYDVAEVSIYFDGDDFQLYINHDSLMFPRLHNQIKS